MQAVQPKESTITVSKEIHSVKFQVFVEDAPNGSESPALTADVLVGSWQTVELHLPAGAALGKVRIRPVDRPAVIEIRELSVHSVGGRVLWVASTMPELQTLQVLGSARPLQRKDRCLFFHFGSDANWVLSVLDEPDAVASVKAVLCIHEDFEAVSQALSTAYQESYAMAAEVRSAFAERNRLLREYQDRAEAALLKYRNQTEALQLAHDELAKMREQNKALDVQLKMLEADQENLRQSFSHFEHSLSWRVTRPLRSASTLARKLRKNLD